MPSISTPAAIVGVTVLHDLETLEIRTCISGPDRGPQSWTDQEAERDAVYANRRRIRGDRGKRLLRNEGNCRNDPAPISMKPGRLLIHAGAFNLGLWMRTLFGIGMPPALQGRLAAFGALLSALRTLIDDAKTATGGDVATNANRPPLDRIHRRGSVA
jgi:transposase